ncbi:putative YkwD family protein [Symbiobacterium terraclitae]|uniref:YkwD family protein n=1 Tax=Symbiobacterium terraclitae TaxID=557451 RepID=A0ABS4JSS2_9FIRM|nr:S-layer homology domain-containing protein [Symbiobacterium terraclitae]MBP2018587.1 putative YkwD family protein [Symbiobacterium terraclitae]
MPMRSHLRTLATSLIAAVLVAATARAAPAGYADQAQIPAWAAADVAFTSQAGIFRGDAATGAFRPNDQITRAEAVTAILRAFSLEADPTVKVPFTDIRGGWYEEPVTRAVQAGVIRSGDFGSRFRPDKPITRAELARMLARAAEAQLGTAPAPTPTVTFSDVDPHEPPFGPYIMKAAGYGIIRGMGDGTFAPEQTATRAQAAVMLARAVRLAQSAGHPGGDPEPGDQGGPGPGAGDGPSPGDQSGQGAWQFHEFELRVAELVNAERAAAGLQPLRLDPDLSRVARLKSQDFVTQGYFSHQSPTYGSPFEMMARFGIRYRGAAENIARGQRTPEEVHKDWMNSSGHRGNIMNPDYDTIGVGFYENGWTQLFIQSR